MAVLEKIRVKFGILISILVALALLSFILDPQTLRSAMDMMSSENKVGQMDGESVSYKEFYEEYDHYQKVAEIMGQKANDEESQASLRDAAWQSIFDKMVFMPKAKSAGINVCDQEMVELTQGSSISPLLLQQGMFYDEQGNFSRERLASFVQNMDLDETGYSALYWNFLEETIYRNQLYTKYGSLIEKSTVKNAVEAANMVSENNVASDVDYVLIPLGYEKDSTITVSNAEIKKYYNDHKKLMKQPANRSLEYVMFEVVPSVSDVNEAREEFDRLAEEFKTAENVRNFVTLNSDSKWDVLHYSAQELEAVPEFVDLVNNGKVGDMSESHIGENSFSVARLVDVCSMAESAKVSYMAFPMTDEAQADEQVASYKKEAPEVSNESVDFTQQALVANNLAELLPVLSSTDKVLKIKSNTHQAIFVIYVHERSQVAKKYQLATFVKNVLPSEETYRDFLMKATELSDASKGDYKEFSKICKEQELPVIPANNIGEATRRIGVVDNARELVRWAFEKGNKVGNVSDVIVVDNKYYYVAALTEIHKEGYLDISQVSTGIKDLLYFEKALDKKLDQVKSELAGESSLEAVADKYNLIVSQASGIAFGSSQNMISDPKFVGSVAAAKEGEFTIAKGGAGIYVFKVTKRDVGTFFTDEDIKTQTLRASQYQANLLQPVLADEANIKDNRARFF